MIISRENAKLQDKTKISIFNLSLNFKWSIRMSDNEYHLIWSDFIHVEIEMFESKLGLKRKSGNADRGSGAQKLFLS